MKLAVVVAFALFAATPPPAAVKPNPPAAPVLTEQESVTLATYDAKIQYRYNAFLRDFQAAVKPTVDAEQDFIKTVNAAHPGWELKGNANSVGWHFERKQTAAAEVKK